MKNYDWVTQEMFDSKLKEIINQTPASTLLNIPGVYEAMSEHFNNDVLEECEIDHNRFRRRVFGTPSRSSGPRGSTQRPTGETKKRSKSND